MAGAIIVTLVACSTARMDTTNPLNLTRNAKLLLAAAGLLLWGIGGTLDGASLRSLVSVPVFVAVWMGLIWVIDRWVRPNAERNRQVFATDELFEQGRAVLTEQGQQRLNALAPWLEGLKHKGSDVVVASYADPRRMDPAVSRVLTRLQSHYRQFEDGRKVKDPVGRMLDFLAQEMNREINTIGSKANDSRISREVVVLKAELEKFREQAQNVE